ncbi:transketolase [Polynucleobacter sp. es-EL-1]|nr:transketolase [Polynucleobacter sp. es-EL-1]
MRNAFIDELLVQAEINNKIALVVGDLGYSVVESFAERFPERFINAGVAEQNMMGLAAGMASEGYHVFVYSIANFPTFRCAEQIRNDVAYHKLPVTVVAVGGGLGYGNLGYSHHAIQDYALIRAMPNMLIAAPGDPMEVRSCLRYLIKNPGPSYLRLGKSGEVSYHIAPPIINPGGWVQLRSGSSNCALLSTGTALQISMEWAGSHRYKNHSIYSMPLWSMFDKPAQYDLLIKHKEVITIEDHLIDGGFGSWFLEASALNQKLAGIVRPVALSHKICGRVGSQLTLHRFGGLCL